MKIFECQNCKQLLYFENRVCMNCGFTLGYLPDKSALSAVKSEEGGWRPMADDGRLYKFCANADEDACNWLLPADDEDAFCEACRHNKTIPDLSNPNYLLRWQKLELAKHRLIYTLKRLRLPIASRADDPNSGLAFDFIADPEQSAQNAQHVITGHESGLITINLAEADDSERERTRGTMGEPYRTLLGHLRHEVGHFYWERLIKQGARLDEFRTLFGDESIDYATALSAHYANGPAAGWQERYVSGYASAHPWEDFAETWAHYLHIVDTLETARAFQLRVDPVVGDDPELAVEINFDPFKVERMEGLIHAWLPLTYAVNSLNRSMGQPDLYPFVLTAPVLEKLDFIHAVIRENRV